MLDSTTEETSLLPEPLRRPIWLIGTLVVPQFVLFLLNLRSWWLVAGEMAMTQQRDAAFLAGASVLLWCAGLGSACWMSHLRIRMDWRHGVCLMVGHAAYLWAFTATFSDIVPQSVPEWMLPRGMLLYNQFGLLMPALLHGALLIASFASRKSLGMEIGRTAGLSVGIPVIGYLFVNVMEHVFRPFGGNLVFPVALLFFVSLTALLIICLLRLFMLLGQGFQRWGGTGRMLVACVVGLAGPIGGLLLNARIPFPVDFQSPGVYALAIVNGLALLLPVAGARPWHRLVWLVQCALFAFSAYFMLVFLPFLPLSLLAVVAMGAGLLMLVPLILFVIHAQQIAAGWRAVRAGTAANAWTAAGLAAILLLPAGYAWRAHGDRAALNAALDHLHSPDYAQNRFNGDLASLRRTLENLRDFKDGLQLPFLSTYYNDVVYGGLVLPDEKLHKLHQTFFGKDLPPSAPGRFGSGLWGSPRRSASRGWTSSPPPTNTVNLVSLESLRGTEDDCETLVAKLVIHNTGSVQAEYVARIHHSPSVFVTGYWLHINADRVPGRIFEKKAALWVYEMIRDMTRRDPGLLLYRNPTTVELRVFPLAPGETRTTEIEFMWPRGFQPIIRVGDRTMETRTAIHSPAVLTVPAAELGRMVVVSPPLLRAQESPRSTTAPYLHVILDASESAKPALLASRIRTLASHVPGLADVVVSAANFEMETLTTAPVPLDQLDSVVRQIRLPSQGGFCRDRALKCALAWHATHAPQRPVVIGVILADTTRSVVADDDLAHFATWHSSARGYMELGSSGEPRSLDFLHQPRLLLPGGLTSIIVDGRPLLVPLDGDEPILSALPPSAETKADVSNARYRKAAAAWLRYANWIQHPADRDEERTQIVADSRSANTLTPLTAFIVVENSAQWRLLEEKEKQKLRNKDDLEIQKAPEPATWILASSFAVWLIWRRLRKATKATHRDLP